MNNLSLKLLDRKEIRAQSWRMGGISVAVVTHYVLLTWMCQNCKITFFKIKYGPNLCGPLVQGAVSVTNFDRRVMVYATDLVT